jgi:hypothetical protein
LYSFIIFSMLFGVEAKACQNHKSAALHCIFVWSYGFASVGFVFVILWSVVCGVLGWSGLVWSRVVWSGLVWSGVVWSGVVWCGLGCSGDSNTNSKFGFDFYQIQKEITMFIRLASWLGFGLSGFLIVVWDGLWSVVCRLGVVWDGLV